MSPSGSLTVLVKDTGSGAGPLVVLASIATVGGWLSVMPRPVNSSQLTLAPPVVATKYSGSLLVVAPVKVVDTSW